MRAAIKIRLIALLVLTAVVFGVSVNATPSTAYAAEVLNFDTTDVLDDLRSSTDNGEAFDINDYPFDESKDIQVINFVEYCYSYKANMRGNYGLYVYVYNPKGLNLSTSSKSNKVQMAVSYDSEGNPNDYAKFDLQFLSKSEESDYKNLFYKFKIVDREINGTTFAERVNSNERRYDVSGIELMTYGDSNATEYAVNGTYKFTGYSEGYGPDASAKSTLNSTVEYLETVTLDVKHTFYRTKTSANGAGYQNQLDTVYFAVPQRFFDTYGKLQRIKAEWYEYKTKDIVVTSNKEFYDKVLPYVGYDLGEPDEFGTIRYNEDIYYSLGQNAGDAGGGVYMAGWGWNLGTGYLHSACRSLYYLFETENIEEYDPYADIVDNGGVESNALYEYIKNYDKTYDNGTLPIKEGTISADLFADDIDDYRKMDNAQGKIRQGYSYYDFDADVDLQKLTSWQEGNPSFWENWITWGLWDTIFGNIPEEESRTVSPIYTVKAEDLEGSDEEISERLLINANDVSALKSYYNDAVTVSCIDDEEKQVVLFRFATSDYYSAAVDIMELGKGAFGQDKHTSGQAYRAWESVFLDFDIIQLTFNRDGVYKVIPVVSSPMDIVNAITPPVQMPSKHEWWKILLAVLIVVLLVIILLPVLPWIVKGLFWLVTVPFKAIAALLKRLQEKKKEKKYKEQSYANGRKER